MPRIRYKELREGIEHAAEVFGDKDVKVEIPIERRRPKGIRHVIFETENRTYKVPVLKLESITDETVEQYKV